MKELLNTRRCSQIKYSCLLIMMTIMSLSSCSSADISEIVAEKVSLTVNISKQTPTTTFTRAIGDVIENINIMVFNGQGNLIGSAFVSDNSTSVTLPVRVSTGCTICAIANTGNSSYLDGISTISELRAKIIPPVSSATTLAEKTNEILYGETSGVDITTSTATQSVSLKRLYSKYTFTITTSSDIVITDYQLCNVPNECFIASGNSNNPTVGYNGLNDSSVSVSASAGSVVTAGPYCLYENLAGKNNSLTAVEQRTSTNAPSCASYILINARKYKGLGLDWKSAYRIYLGGVTSTINPVVDCTDFNIYRNYDYKCNISISGSGINDARVTYEVIEPTLKQFLFSDGTYGNISDNPGKTPIAIVFSTTLSAQDKTKNYHGYAMALKNASTGAVWGPNGSTPTGSASTTLNIADYDGLTYTGKINNSTYPAANAATTYDNTVPAPIGTSGWFLPSVSQWYQICLNLGGMSTPFTDDRTSGSLHWDNQSTACVNAINTAMNEVGDGNYDPFLAADQNYWSSSENDSDDAYCVLFFSNGALGLASLDKSSYTNYVRPVIAF